MADVYVKTVNGGENTSPSSTDAVEIDDGVNSEWTTLANLVKGAVAPSTSGNVLTSNGTDWTSAAPAGGREKLSSARTYYVATAAGGGSDANNGLSVGAPFLTIQKAVDIISELDISGNIVTVQVADGTYTTPVILKNVIGFAALGNFVIQGNSGTPANVVISTTSNNAFSANNLYTAWDIKNMKIQTTTSGSCIYAEGAVVRYGGTNFGACAGQHLYSASQGNIISIANYTVSGSPSGAHLAVTGAMGSILHQVTATANLTFTHWVYAAFSSNIGLTSSSYSLGAYTMTGKKYTIEYNAVVYSGVTQPGASAGTATNGGIYV